MAIIGDIRKITIGGNTYTIPTGITVESDPVFSASPAAGITATDISNWNAKVSDDKTWNGVVLGTNGANIAANVYIPTKEDTTLSGTADWATATTTPTAYAIAKYDGSSYLKSTTPSANDNSTKVATTAYVDGAIPDISGKVSKSGDTMTGNLILDLNNTNPSKLQLNYSSSMYVTLSSQGGESNITFLTLGNETGLGASSGKVRVRGVSAPVLNHDAANKKYVDDKVGALSIPTISLNGSSTTSASFYAPTTAGTSGQVLTSNGSGAPTWAAAAGGSSTQIIRWTES